MYYKIAIVGAEESKFTPRAETRAKQIIADIIAKRLVGHYDNEKDEPMVVSGHCHLGGVDIWAEDIAKLVGVKTQIFAPKQKNWSHGYKPRNIQIAKACNEIHNIVVDVLPPKWDGTAFDVCYHCKRYKFDPFHVKSGGCWTAHFARALRKPAYWHVVSNGDNV